MFSAAIPGIIMLLPEIIHNPEGSTINIAVLNMCNFRISYFDFKNSTSVLDFLIFEALVVKQDDLLPLD
jgi:hypothetical protein